MFEFLSTMKKFPKSFDVTLKIIKGKTQRAQRFYSESNYYQTVMECFFSLDAMAHYIVDEYDIFVNKDQSQRIGTSWLQPQNAFALWLIDSDAVNQCKIVVNARKQALIHNQKNEATPQKLADDAIRNLDSALMTMCKKIQTKNAPVAQPKMAGPSNVIQPCVILLDTSNSMNSRQKNGKTRIQELNEAIPKFKADLERFEKGVACTEVAFVEVSETVSVLQDFRSVDRFKIYDLIADGEATCLNEAIEVAIDMCEKRKMVYRERGDRENRQIPYYRPWIWVVSDGEATDKFAFSRTKQKLLEALDHHVAFFGVPIGDKAAEHLKQYLPDYWSEDVKNKFIVSADSISGAFQLLSNSVSNGERNGIEKTLLRLSMNKA